MPVLNSRVALPRVQVMVATIAFGKCLVGRGACPTQCSCCGAGSKCQVSTSVYWLVCIRPSSEPVHTELPFKRCGRNEHTSMCASICASIVCVCLVADVP